MSLITTVRTELIARKGEWPGICAKTGLSYWWLTKVAQGRIRSPGVVKLEALQAHFSVTPRPSTPSSEASASESAGEVVA